MPNVTIGMPGIVEQPIERVFDPQRGPSTTRRFKGERVAILNAKSVFDAASWSTRTVAGPVWTLEATAGLDTDGITEPVDVPIDTWELTANVAEKDILQSDSALIQSAMTYVLDIKKLRDLIKGSSKFEDFDESDFVADDAWTVARMIAGGVQSRVVYQPILRHSQAVSYVYQIPASLTNVGNVLLSTTLSAQEAVPTNILNNLPASGAAITRDTITYRYGWLKTHPTIVNSANSKTTISQEWQWGLWPTGLYTVL